MDHKIFYIMLVFFVSHHYGFLFHISNLHWTFLGFQIMLWIGYLSSTLIYFHQFFCKLLYRHSFTHSIRNITRINFEWIESYLMGHDPLICWALLLTGDLRDPYSLCGQCQVITLDKSDNWVTLLTTSRAGNILCQPNILPIIRHNCVPKFLAYIKKIYFSQPFNDYNFLTIWIP